MREVIVVGNGVSGFACAARLADEGISVTMIGPGLPHDRPPLSKRAILTGRVPLLADAAQMAERGIEHLDGLIEGVDLDRRHVTVRSSDGATVELEAPALVWATGLRYPKPPIAGFALAEQNTSGAGLESLHRHLDIPGRRVVIVGAGLIGTETAATIAAAHHVTLLDMVDRPLARFLPQVSDAARAVLETLGVRFVGSCRIDGATWDGAHAIVHTSTHGDIPCDVLISAAGFGSSLPPELTGGEGRTLTVDADEQLRVIGRVGVWACGDCVSFPHPRFGRIGIPHWDHALWSGRHVAGSILGSSEPYTRDPYFFSDIGKLRIQQVGLAGAVAEWNEDDGLVIGRDPAGAPACVLLLNAPARLREARGLVASPAL